jgi:hypothetical protein
VSSGSYPAQPKLKAAGLWQRTSASGNVYFAGRLGGVRILIFENRDRTDDSEPSHHLFFVDGEARPEAVTHPDIHTTPSGTGSSPAAGLSEIASACLRRSTDARRSGRRSMATRSLTCIAAAFLRLQIPPRLPACFSPIEKS